MAKVKPHDVRSAGRSHRLWLLKYEVGDDRFLRIFEDLSALIRKSERAYKKATKSDNPEYAEAVGEIEGDYLEELIGASFIVLQAKIRRVQSAAEKLAAFSKEQHGVSMKGLDRQSVIGLGGNFKRTGTSLIGLVWAIGNYYKHRDEWPSEVWTDKKAGEIENGALRQSRGTRKRVEAAGIAQFGTGNMRIAYEFLGIKPYSACDKFAAKVQGWANDVLAQAEKELKESVDAKPRN